MLVNTFIKMKETLILLSLDVILTQSLVDLTLVFINMGLDMNGKMSI
jgi:hypothetical protein